MSESSAKPYHHGNLREAMVDAAEALLAEGGIQALSLRAAARHIGVSQAAPYAHFSGKQALLAALGTRGFNRLAEYMHQAERAADTGAERIRLLGRAYVAFALDYPMLFRLMFGPELCGANDAELQQAGQASHAPIQNAVTAQAFSVGSDALAADASLAAWALVHGLAMLIVDGKQPWPDSAADRDALVDRVVSAYSIAAMGAGH